MLLSPQSNTASVPCHEMTYVCTEDTWQIINSTEKPLFQNTEKDWGDAG